MSSFALQSPPLHPVSPILSLHHPCLILHTSDRILAGTGEHAYNDAPHVIHDDILDLNYVPPTLETDDPIDQAELRHSVRGSVFTADQFRMVYDSHRPAPLHLSYLRRLYERKDQKAAMALLDKVHFLKVDNDYLYAYDHPDVVWGSRDVRFFFSSLAPTSSPSL